MSSREKILIVGIGSAHGDDQVGWLVAELISTLIQDRSLITVRKAGVPLDLLDWLENVNVLHLIDAYDVNGCRENFRRFIRLNGGMFGDSDNAFAETVFNQKSARSSHGFSVPDVLRLAEKTGMLPETIAIWAIPGSDFQPGAPLSEQSQNSISEVASCIMAELSAAYA